MSQPIHFPYLIGSHLALVSALFFAGSVPVAAQEQWKKVESPVQVELRGLSVVNKNVAWASGAKGTVLRTTDGETWENVSIAKSDPEAIALDFRDIQGLDKSTAIAMSAGPGKASTIYKTRDGGEHWERVLVNQEASGFWDAIDFWDAQNGVIYGDPVNGQFQVLLTQDGGQNWRPAARDSNQLNALANEGAFAASGTCVATHGRDAIWLVTGGAEKTRVFYSVDRGQTWEVSSTPLAAGKPPRGLFSIAFTNSQMGMAVGGDYQKAKEEGVNAVLTEDGGKTWRATTALPVGFLSVVVAVPGQQGIFVVGGLAGSGVSKDGGATWEVLGETPLNAMAFADALHGWAVGPKGLIMKYAGKRLARK
ncbi:WD40/YVTN/BNR-like repeat-containing protein [Undibacterium fentianense]|uniref:Photosynthesis system II assembly factor Ycf48/Hcf136-like domain-containing protein n=1 Tax=Undibacterium fentianense TaxID=2828728 RepID=A0A941IG54_9BURK|nr:YCF48-related protein [Undibacterium fentianense]MBR7801032.1 hypothetical protein [Undibacterium fentianense]